MAFLRQDQFGYEDERVLDVVMMGHERDVGLHAGEGRDLRQPGGHRRRLHARRRTGSEVRRVDGYTAEARAGELLLGVGIPTEQHNGPMREVAPGWKLRVLLCQALFANPDILLLDEPTNNLDINTIRWLEDVLNDREHHDHHLPRPPLPEPGVHPHGRPGLRHDPGLPGQLRRLHGSLDPGPRAQQAKANAKAKEKVAELQEFVRRFSANKSKAKQATSRAKQIEKIKVEDMKPSSASTPGSASSTTRRKSCTAWPCEVENLTFGYDPDSRSSRIHLMPSKPATRSPSSARTASARPPCCACWPASAAGHRNTAR
jgi:ATPase subunit of ABC transporter with duplicated ATPase domains